MSSRWILFLYLSILVLMILSSIIEGNYITSTQNTLLTQMMGEKVNIVSKIYVFWKMTWFDFAFFKNPDGTANGLAVARYFLYGFSIAFWIVVVLQLMQGVSSLIRRIPGVGI